MDGHRTASCSTGNNQPTCWLRPYVQFVHSYVDCWLLAEALLTVRVGMAMVPAHSVTQMTPQHPSGWTGSSQAGPKGCSSWSRERVRGNTPCTHLDSMLSTVVVVPLPSGYSWVTLGALSML